MGQCWHLGLWGYFEQWVLVWNKGYCWIQIWILRKILDLVLGAWTEVSDLWRGSCNAEFDYMSLSVPGYTLLGCSILISAGEPLLCSRHFQRSFMIATTDLDVDVLYLVCSRTSTDLRGPVSANLGRRPGRDSNWSSIFWASVVPTVDWVTNFDVFSPDFWAFPAKTGSKW